MSYGFNNLGFRLGVKDGLHSPSPAFANSTPSVTYSKVLSLCLTNERELQGNAHAHAKITSTDVRNTYTCIHMHIYIYIHTHCIRALPFLNLCLMSLSC